MPTCFSFTIMYSDLTYNSSFNVKWARKRNFGHNHADSPNTMAIENLKQIKATLEKKVPIFGKIKRLVVPCL